MNTNEMINSDGISYGSTDEQLTDTDICANVHPNFVPITEEKIRSFRTRSSGSESNSNNECQEIDRKHEQASDEALLEIKTEHLTIYQSIYNFYKFLGIFFGIECRHEWKRYRHPFFWVTNFLLFLSHFSVVYTAYVYYRGGDLMKMLEPFAVCGIALTCTLKWAVFLKYMHNLLQLMFAVRKICEEINSGNRVDSIIASLKKSYSLIRAFTIALMSSILFFVSIPLKFFVVDHIYYPLVPILIPLCDETTLKGYLLATLMHSLMGIYSSISTLMFGSAFLIVICNYGLMVNLIELDFQDLNDMWSPSSETPIPMRHAFLNNIALKLQDMQRYMKEVKLLYEKKFFMFFLISYIGQVICLYEITEKNWLPGYSSLFTVFVEMMFYCMVGTQLTVMGDKMCNFIQRMDWYIFDIHSQKTLRFILQQCQRPCTISLRSLGNLNMVTGVAVIKGVYYYYTVITEVL